MKVSNIRTMSPMRGLRFRSSNQMSQACLVALPGTGTFCIILDAAPAVQLQSTCLELHPKGPCTQIVYALALK